MLIGVQVGAVDGADVGLMVPTEYVFQVIKTNRGDIDPYRGPAIETAEEGDD
jgi:hypothetical protein